MGRQRIKIGHLNRSNIKKPIQFTKKNTSKRGRMTWRKIIYCGTRLEGFTANTMIGRVFSHEWKKEISKYENGEYRRREKNKRTKPGGFVLRREL